ncbi:SusC/RagA family TonB-linked outer membrane protein [Flavobacterium cellulosilyticum]|uniref:TonB-dependent receptor n=1 Tax=Flavobacterium cellulosilyticum TaxID=2541731 RepID=A0A4R5CPI5_9FLAO|nr:TonB-dependent receptor [Flavobacterium cellulosilyticum]TDD99482.1 TonB-dependent receptor [Flavobacterium cellulosilyticum]
MTNFLIKSKSKHFKHLAYLLLMFIITSGVNAQSTITGTVSDASGPIPGANVILKGTNNGITTTIDGTYSINNIPTGGTLVFTFVGLKNKEVTVKGQTRINVILEQELSTLSEVVVIGYGTQRKEAVTGSVVSMNAEELREIPAANISQALQGRLTGVDISQTSTKPGANMQIRIRGTRSLSADNNPLVVLDGVPFSGNISDINPNNIKSIDILKDASATAIYGSRGANGVILVTSIGGKKGQKAQFTYNQYYGTKRVFGEYPLMNGAEFVKLRKLANRYSNGTDEFDNVDTNWQKLLYTTGTVTSHDMGVSGGSEYGAYNYGLGYYKDEAVIPGQNYERITMNGSLNQEIGAFKFGFSTNNNYSVNNGNGLGVGGVLSMSPITDPYNADGSLKRVVHMGADDAFVTTKDVLKGLGDKYIDQTRAFGSYNNIFGEVKIPGVEGLKYRINLGLNFRANFGGSYTGEGVFNVNPTTISSANVNSSISTNLLLENLITYDRTFAEKHKVNFVGLYSNETNNYNSSSFSAKDIASDDFQFYNLRNANGEIVANDGNYTQGGLRSYMARGMYTYDNKYMITATVRSDGSSRLAPGHKWHTYPAVSAGWNIMNESFMKNVKAIDALKIRVGYGETSNQAVSPYQTLGSLAPVKYNFGNTNYATGYYVNRLPSPDLGWEFSQTWNYGLDFAILKNRLTGTVEYYNTQTKDLLLGVSLPSTAGVGSYTANIGATENKGFEVALNGIILDNPNGLTWELGVNISANKNKIVSLASGQDRDEGNWWFVGHSINSIFDYEKIGLWQKDDANLTKYEPGGNVGMIKVKYTGDLNADGTPTRQIGAADRQILNVDPDFVGGLNTRFTYKGFDLSAVGVFRSGGLINSTLYGSGGYLNLLSGRRANVKVDYYTADNTDATYPAPGGIQSGDNPKYGSTLGYFDGTYLKIRTITLGYNFKKQMLEGLGLQKLRLYCTVQNPFVFFSDYNKESGMDPESNSLGNENAAVNLSNNLSRILTIGANTPSTKNVVFGLNLTF